MKGISFLPYGVELAFSYSSPGKDLHKQKKQDITLNNEPPSWKVTFSVWVPVYFLFPSYHSTRKNETLYAGISNPIMESGPSTWQTIFWMIEDA